MLFRTPKSLRLFMNSFAGPALVRNSSVAKFFTIISVLFLFAVFPGQQSALAQSFNYANFNSIAGLQLNGNAAQTTLFPPLRLRLTDNSTGGGANQVSSVYYNTKVNVVGGFTTTFQFQVSSVHAGTNGGGEGITFIIQNSPSGLTALGPGGADLGYATIPNSFVVELDMALNAGYDSTDNHISVHTLGTNPNSAVDLTASIAAASFPQQLKDGAIHSVKITYDGVVGWDIYLDNLGTSLVGFNYALGAATNSATAYVGFTSSTGSGNNVQTNDILNWSFSSNNPTAADGNVSGVIVDGQGKPVEGAVVNLNGTEMRKTITNAKGFYQFDSVETSGFYNVSASRANYTFSPSSRSFSALGSHTEAAFTGSSNGDNANPLDTAEYFVRQQYVDILGREPDEGGFNYWSNEILGCGGDSACTDRRRREVAASFFIAEEFQDTGSFIYDMYKGSLGRKPVFNEYSADRKQVVGGSTLMAQKAAFADSFVNRTEFVQKYQGETTAESFVDALLQNVQQSSQLDLGAQRTGLINQYNAGGTLAQSRSLVLRSLADNAALKQKEYNAAFVLTEYFGYLRRNPEPEGYDFWLNVVTNGDVGNYRGMVCSFITSTEYQQRFSSVVSHSNAECSQ
jgi:Legume lectin domain/Carboxypeptidase regulatory-like domain/Domain of unknown function (DUF4214)